MFKELNSQQKFIFVALGIVALVCLILAIYFALSKKSPPPPPPPPPPPQCPNSAPSFIKFSSKAEPPTKPWNTGTFYKYTYFDIFNVEGPQSESSAIVISTTTAPGTNPIIQVSIDTSSNKYNIKLYRAVDDGSGNIPIPSQFKPLTPQPTIDNNGNFTDTQNPAPSPTTPPKPTGLITFNGFSSTPPTPPTYPWYYKTFYKYAYVDKNDATNIGEFSDTYPSTSDPQVQSTTATNPSLKVSPNPLYNIVIQRSVNDISNFILLSPQPSIDNNGNFTDTLNPYKAPSTPLSKPTFKGWTPSGGGVQCPTGSTRCDTTPCSAGHIGNCTDKVGAPWSCYDGVVGCSDNPGTFESPNYQCNHYCKNV